jgi:hypothetical protein
MLVAVREMGVRIGVVSDWGSNLRDILAGLELDRYLDFVLPSGSVGLAKPNPAFFRVALEAVDARPEEALMVGDSYRADIRGAWAAGLDAVWLDRTEGINITPSDEPAPADVRVIRSLDEVPRSSGAVARCREATSPISSRPPPAEDRRAWHGPSRRWSSTSSAAPCCVGRRTSPRRSPSWSASVPRACVRSSWSAPSRA